MAAPRLVDIGDNLINAGQASFALPSPIITFSLPDMTSTAAQQNHDIERVLGVSDTRLLINISAFISIGSVQRKPATR